MSDISDAIDAVDAGVVTLAGAVADFAALDAADSVDATDLLAWDNARRAVRAAQADLDALVAASLALQAAG